MSNHPLVSDGISLQLLPYLAKPSRKMEPARVFIPPTVIFDQGFASSWYYSTSGMSIKKRNDKDISAHDIYREFSLPSSSHPDCDIVAVFYLAKETTHFVSDVKPVFIDTTYLNQQLLQDFLFRPGEKPKGILQKFVYPQGLCVTTIQAMWSRNVTMMEAVRNPNALTDKTKSLDDRGGTLELASAKQISTTNTVTAAVRQLCGLIVQHLQAVDHIQVHGMVLQFRVDAQNRVQLLSATSMRVQKTDLGLIGKDAPPPLNLMHHFVGVRERAARALEKETNQQAKAIRRRVSTVTLSGGSPKASTPSPTRSMASNSSTPMSSKPEMARSKVYKEAALRLLSTCPPKMRSKLVLPALLGAVKHNGRRWIGLSQSPTPVGSSAPTPLPTNRSTSVPLHHLNLPETHSPKKGTPRKGGTVARSPRVVELMLGGNDHSPLNDEDATVIDSFCSVESQSDYVNSVQSPALQQSPNHRRQQQSALEERRTLSEILYRIESAFLACSSVTLTHHAVFDAAYLDEDLGFGTLQTIFSTFDVVRSDEMVVEDIPSHVQDPTVWPLKSSSEVSFMDGDGGVYLVSFSCPQGRFQQAIASCRWNLMRHLKQRDESKRHSHPMSLLQSRIFRGPSATSSRRTTSEYEDSDDEDDGADDEGTSVLESTGDYSIPSPTPKSRSDRQAPAPSTM